MSTVQADRGVDRVELETKVKEMYQRVAEDPTGEFHFEMGRALAERLGYDPADLDRIPPEAIDSFAGVGYHIDLARLAAGLRVLDLGSGSGMDTFVAALKVGPDGRVDGVDMTDAQRAKAERQRERAGFNQVRYHKSYIETLPFDDETFDAVISNGVINLRPTSRRCFAKRRGCCGRAGGSRSPTSSPRSHCRRASPAMRRCGPPVSAVPCSRMRTTARSARRALRSNARARTRNTASSPPRPKRRATYGVRSVSLVAVKP